MGLSGWLNWMVYSTEKLSSLHAVGLFSHDYIYLVNDNSQMSEVLRCGSW